MKREETNSGKHIWSEIEYLDPDCDQTLKRILEREQIGPAALVLPLVWLAGIIGIYTNVDCLCKQLVQVIMIKCGFCALPTKGNAIWLFWV